MTLQIDPALQPGRDNYKLLTSLVVPRPIAWITSVSEAGVVNLAPFSFFNAVNGNPPTVIVSIGTRDDGSPKDTARNIESRAQFVVNLVTEELLRSMNISAVEFPPDESELLPAELHGAASARIQVPRLAQAQVSLECQLVKCHSLGTYTLYIAEVVMFHAAEHLIGPRLHVNDFAPIGRLGAPSLYCRTTDRFELPRISYSDWQKRNG